VQTSANWLTTCWCHRLSCIKIFRRISNSGQFHWRLYPRRATSHS